MEFCSRRSVVYSTLGSVASSQPIASDIGLRILQSGGNAVDAAVAMAAALNVTEPCSTGIGGDCFCLFYDAKSQRVSGINGSGRAPAALSLDYLRGAGITSSALPPLSIHTVTVPGAAAGWVDSLATYGTLPLAAVLQPAIELAERGFPVHPTAAHFWAAGAGLLQKPNNPGGSALLLSGRAPRAGDIMRNPDLAATFKLLARDGRDGFYTGRIAEAVVATVQDQGGLLTLDDLSGHQSTHDAPLCVPYRGCEVWELPPNGQGLTALLALNILEGIDVAALGHNSVAYLHTLIEALRLAFADTRYHVADPAFNPAPLATLLSAEYAATRRACIAPDRAMADPATGCPGASSDTVYFTTVDRWGNACSFINSNYMGFGTGLVPPTTGFTLQNRGANFSLEAGHPNVLQGGKRPYHTIIPGMLTRAGRLEAAFGVMGGFMQPQGHVQVLVNMLDFGMNAQQALDAPRVCINPTTPAQPASPTSPATPALESWIGIEAGLDHTVAALQALGHNARLVTGHDRALFGRGQIIRQINNFPVFEAGSDPRADGCASGWS
eukprot:m.237394 g.237394  ORF g.237394 m.237394 type:complete len:553 (-) comp21101_c0_seq1:32-1690(-)